MLSLESVTNRSALPEHPLQDHGSPLPLSSSRGSGAKDGLHDQCPPAAMSRPVKTAQVGCPPAGPGLRKGCVCGTPWGAEELGRKPIHSLWTEFSTDAGLTPLGPCAQPLCVTESSPFSALTLTLLPQTDSRSFLSPLPDPFHLHSADPLNLASRWEPGPLPHRALACGDGAPNHPSPLTGRTVGCGGSRCWPGTNYVPDTFPDTRSLLRISLTLCTPALWNAIRGSLIKAFPGCVPLGNSV